MAPAPGAFTRQLRFGEWISEPVTPLFESWLLSRMEDSLHAQLQRWTGQGAPRPHHVVVNGWYFYSINWLSLGASIRNVPALAWHIIREPRRVAAMIPPTVRHGIALFEREWREDLQPRYRAAIAAAARSVEVTPPSQLPMLVDELADLAGEYFASVAALSGAAYKMEMNLAIVLQAPHREDHRRQPPAARRRLRRPVGDRPPGDRVAWIGGSTRCPRASLIWRRHPITGGSSRPG